MQKAEQSVEISGRISAAMKRKDDENEKDAACPDHATQIAKKLCHDLKSPYFGPPPIDLTALAPHVHFVTGFERYPACGGNVARLHA